MEVKIKEHFQNLRLYSVYTSAVAAHFWHGYSINEADLLKIYN